jgi:hypothetical protein
MKKTIMLNESDLIKMIKKVISEQSSGDMMSFEKVVEVPNTPKLDLFNSLKSNRDLFRNGTLQNEVAGQLLKVEKKVLLDKNLFKSLGLSYNITMTCYNGPLTFDVTIFIKDDKYKILCDNFIWTNQGSGCNVPMSFNPLTTTRPKGMSMGPAWDKISEAVNKYTNNFIQQVTTAKQNTDF